MLAHGAQPNFAFFQSALVHFISGLNPVAAASSAREIEYLPDWNQGPGRRPRQLQDLLRPDISLRLWFDPALGGRVCSLLGVDPHDFFQREVRPGRLLPACSKSVSLTLTGLIHVSPATQIIQILKGHPGVRLKVKRAREIQPVSMSLSVFQWIQMGFRASEEITLIAEGPGHEEVLKLIEERNRAGWKLREQHEVTSQTRRISGRMPVAVAEELLTVMSDFKVTSLSGIYHVFSQVLYVGSSSRAHTAIAEDAGFKDQSSYVRIHFESDGDSLRAVFPECGFLQMEAFAGRHELKAWLRELFDEGPEK